MLKSVKKFIEPLRYTLFLPCDIANYSPSILSSASSVRTPFPSSRPRKSNDRSYIMTLGVYHSHLHICFLHLFSSWALQFYHASVVSFLSLSTSSGFYFYLFLCLKLCEETWRVCVFRCIIDVDGSFCAVCWMPGNEGKYRKEGRRVILLKQGMMVLWPVAPSCSSLVVTSYYFLLLLMVCGTGILGWY